jgi:hypothetical protein
VERSRSGDAGETGRTRSEDPHDPEAWRLVRLRHALQALAAPADRQRALFLTAAGRVCIADELALDFDDGRRVALEGREGAFSAAELGAIDALDRELTAMSRGGARFRATLWTDAALDLEADWRDVRRLAAFALAAFGWPAELPPADPRDRGTHYVR